MQGSPQQNQTEGLKARMVKGFGKFMKAGSVWSWEFAWAKSGNLCNGYDQGVIDQGQTDIFERLKTRFFRGVFLNTNTKTGLPYHKAASWFKVYLCDDHIFTITCGDSPLSFALSESADKFFSGNEKNYMEGMYAQFAQEAAMGKTKASKEGAGFQALKTAISQKAVSATPEADVWGNALKKAFHAKNGAGNLYGKYAGYKHTIDDKAITLHLPVYRTEFASDKVLQETAHKQADEDLIDTGKLRREDFGGRDLIYLFDFIGDRQTPAPKPQTAPIPEFSETEAKLIGKAFKWAAMPATADQGDIAEALKKYLKSRPADKEEANALLKRVMNPGLDY